MRCSEHVIFLDLAPHQMEARDACLLWESTEVLHVTGLCHFLGYLVHDRIPIFGDGFQRHLTFQDPLL